MCVFVLALCRPVRSSANLEVPSRLLYVGNKLQNADTISASLLHPPQPLLGQRVPGPRGGGARDGGDDGGGHRVDADAPPRGAGADRPRPRLPVRLLHARHRHVHVHAAQEPPEAVHGTARRVLHR